MSTTEAPPASRPPFLGLSKSRFVSGLQCSKQLWWKVHEPHAPELATGPALQVVFDRGHRVGALARQHVPGGVLIDLPYYAQAERVAATTKAITEGAPAVYEASFLEDGVFVSVDILERTRGGFLLVEVKSTLSVKDAHIPDVAIQLHVLRRAGLSVKRAEVMHLNKECRHPDLSNLFMRIDVTAKAEATPRGIPKKIRALHAAVSGSLPNLPTGEHCEEPYPCPFTSRCSPPLPKHHVSTLYRIRRDGVQKLLDKGFETIGDLPLDYPATGATARWKRSFKSATSRSWRARGCAGFGRAIGFLADRASAVVEA